MQKSLLIATLATNIMSFSNMVSGEEVCRKCEIIREENKKKVNPYEYYEDYKKDHPNEEQPAQNDDESKENSK